MSNLYVSRELTMSTLKTSGWTTHHVGPISKPHRAKWSPEPWMKVWLVSGKAQVRKQRPTPWRGRFLGRYVNEMTVMREPVYQTIAEAVAAAVEKTSKFYVFGLPKFY